MEKRYNKNDKDFPIYMDFLINYKVGSFILSPNNQSAIAGSHTFFRTKENLKAELFKIIGNEKQKYLDSWNDWQFAYLPSAINELKEIEEEFISFSEQKVNMGFVKPTEYPKNLLLKKLKTEARHDILILEKERIEKELSEYKEVDEQKSESAILKDGAKGIGRTLNSVLVEIDGLKVSKNDEGNLILNDDRKPEWKGYLVSDYYIFVVDIFKRACNQKQKEIQVQIDKGELKESEISKGKKQGRISIPDFPESCKRYLIENVTSK